MAVFSGLVILRSPCYSMLFLMTIEPVGSNFLSLPDMDQCFKLGAHCTVVAMICPSEAHFENLKILTCCL